MFLGILSVIALSVGSVQTANDLAENERLVLEDSQPVVVQVVDQPQTLDPMYELIGL